MSGRIAFYAILGSLTVVAACADAEATEGVPSAAAESGESVALASAPAASALDIGTVTVFKTPSCGCCVVWVDHMREAGFTVEVTDTNSLADVKRQAGVPEDLHTCHTAIVDGLVIEGHVPASTVQQVLADRKGLKGIAVPGMPIGSPGMEVPGRAADAYDVIGFTEDGTRTVVSRH